MRKVVKAGSRPKQAQSMREYWASRKKGFDEIKGRIRKYGYMYREKNKEKQKKYAVSRKYGITWEYYEKLLETQEGKCGICNMLLDPNGSKTVKPYIDHDHSRNYVRGVLCSRCNLLLGNARDSVDILRAARSYLEERSL